MSEGHHDPAFHAAHVARLWRATEGAEVATVAGECRWQVKLPVKKFTETARLPERAHPDDAGLDVFIDDECKEPLWSGETRRVYLGIGVRIPVGFTGLLLPRGSTALRGLHIHSPPIDAGYTGHLSAIVTNLTREHIPLPRGTKLCQLVVMPIATPEVELVEELGDSARGSKAFGSTGGAL
jgi:dUTP pyrophosphatase